MKLKKNISNKNYRTPLHYAAKYDSIKIGELLISKGANIDAKVIIYDHDETKQIKEFK